MLLLWSGALLLMFLLFYRVSLEKNKLMDDVPELVFSRESGFYDADFELTILGPAGRIYYTLDGSVPTRDSIPYTGPITIGDASYQPDVYSARTDVSTGYYHDLIAKYSTSDSGYTVPEKPVDKCTVVRAVAELGNGSYSQVKTASYFVGFEDKEGYAGLIRLSLTADPESWFNEKDGIYVTGDTFRTFLKELENGTADPGLAPYWWTWTANYSRGIAGEIEGSGQFFDENGKLLLSQQLGIRIHGGGSRGLSPKSLNLYARKRYGSMTDIMYPFFGGSYYPKRLTLSQGGDDEFTKSKDRIMHQLCSGMHMALPHEIPCALFLNGEYWGIYWLAEKYDAEFLHYYYGIDGSHGVIIKNGALECGREKDLKLYTEMEDFVKSEDFSDPEKAGQLWSLIDQDSAVDYYAVMLYAARYADWPGGNQMLWRSSGKGKDHYSDGRWRFMLFDMNSPGMDPDMAETDSIAYALQDPFFASLFREPEFRTRLLDRLEELAGEEFSTAAVSAAFLDFRETFDIPMKKHYARFFGTENTEAYEKRLERLESFFEKRRTAIPAITAAYR